MENPFHRRATEQLRDDEAFLAVVSPEPLTIFFKAPSEQGTLYDRLVVIRGTPGSGKTTLARLFDFSAICTLLRTSGSSDFASVAGALEGCRAISDGKPQLVGCRLPMETDYRDFWEFPYSGALKSGLLATFIQARAVLGWFRQLDSAGIRANEVTIQARAEADAALEQIGGTSGLAVVQRARDVERAVYEVVGALVPPTESRLNSIVTGAYRPFDVIDRMQIQSPRHFDGISLSLLPLVILDDAHSLHPAQFKALQHWLARRELRIARWVITRFDILHPAEAIAAVAEDRVSRPSYPGLSAERDIEYVLLQNWGGRRNQRTAFRRIARDMAHRYLQKHPLLGSRRLVDIGALLSEEAESLSESKLKDLRAQLLKAQRKLRVTDSRKSELEVSIDGFRIGGSKVPTDVRLAMLMIMMHRYVNRLSPQALLFEENPDPAREVVANGGVFDAACLCLLHEYSRPYFYGADDLFDASSENAELFLQLAAVLVDAASTQIIRSRPATLSASSQNRMLRERAEQIINAWSFPYVQNVRNLARVIARRCVDVSLQPNGWLAPNGYGVVQAEFDALISADEDAARVLQFAVAYNAITLVPKYDCKGKEWCLLELGGPVCLAFGLTLKRGGFLEGSVSDLCALTKDLSL